MTTAIMTCSKERLDDKIRTFSKFGDSDKGTITLVRKFIAEIVPTALIFIPCKKEKLFLKKGDFS